MSRTHFRLNTHSIFASISTNSLLETCAISEVQVTPTWLEPTTTYFVNEHPTIWSNWANDWAELWASNCAVHLTVCACHIIYLFQSEFTLYICLNVKKLVPPNRRDIPSLCDCDGTQTNNYLVRKWKLKYLAKWTKGLSWVVNTYLYDASEFVFFWCYVRISEWMHNLYLPECQRTVFSKKARYLKFKRLQRNSNPQPLTS